MRGFLCLIGIHSYLVIKRTLSWWNTKYDAYRVTEQCRHCKKLRTYYDTGDEEGLDHD